ncbi:M48 family metallopeptidase [Halobacteriovorax sp. GB3]|uniref:M48 family metallopeptidase n=1 Tax=Halobacteriovorax sp. GB3 TaxID=2719615 RepID=UPI0023623C97|nr:M48 family metallopeptidase [Halobacteriovorax sp. GB3]MDD0853759.1 M48 family metallopeptidase [Halobacteriovorax sp. GB3]
MVNTYLVTKIFLIFLCLKALIEAYLDARNKKHILTHRNEVPEKFKDSITLEDHQKAADYSLAKIKASKFFNLIEFIVLLLWTIGGGLESLNQLTKAIYPQGGLTGGVVFFLLFMAISFFLSLPQSIYSTFVLEEKFGFNKTTPKVFIIDIIKSTLVGLVILIPILYGILWIMSALGNQWWIYAWAFFIGIQLILMWAYPTFIAPIFNKFTPLEEGEVKDKILALLKRTEFESNGLFVMDGSRRSSHGNAYFTGFGKNKRIVFFDTLINSLNAEEIEAVLAHELGHFKKKHIIKMLAKTVVMTLVAFFVLGQLMNWDQFYLGHGVKSMETHMGLILFMLLSGIYTFFLTPLSSLQSRKYEFEADEFAANHSNAQDLITALVKMYKDNASTLTPDPTYSAWYHSHPPALIRVKFLEKFLK